MRQKPEDDDVQLHTDNGASGRFFLASKKKGGLKHREKLQSSLRIVCCSLVGRDRTDGDGAIDDFQYSEYGHRIQG